MTNRQGNRGMPVPPELAPEVESEEPALVEAPIPSSKPLEPESMRAVQPVSAKGVEVVAMGPGFYRNCRKVEGDRFVVASLEKCGSWMKCLDPKMEALRVEKIKAEKRKANAGQ